MDINTALRRLGKCGRWQLLALVLIAFSGNFLCVNTVSSVFIGFIPPHHCTIPANRTLNETIPKKADGSLEECIMFKKDSNETMPCSEGWHYTLIHGPTIVSEWDLVCDKSYLLELSQTLFMVGLGISGFFITALADYFGRKPVHITAAVLAGGLGVILAWVPNYIGFVTIRFLMGVLIDGVYGSYQVWLSEHFPVDTRVTFTSISVFTWPISMWILNLIAFLIPHWRYFQMTFGILCMIPFLYIWILDESVPWLAATNKIEKAEHVLARAARINGIKGQVWSLQRSLIVNSEGVCNGNTELLQVTEKQHLSKLDDSENTDDIVVKGVSTNQTNENCHVKESHEKGNILDVLRHKRLRIHFFIIIILWFVNNVTYYGLVLGIGTLAGNLYVNFLITGVMDLFACVACLSVSKWFGRLPAIVGGLLICGICLIVSTFIPSKTANGVNLAPLIVTLIMIGICSTSTCFETIAIHTGEVYPTHVRNLAYGISMASGRIGGIISPFYSYMARYARWLPPIVVGTASIVTALAAITLPETKGRPLFQSIAEMDQWNKNRLMQRSQHKTKNSQDQDEQCRQNLPINDSNPPRS